VSESILVIACGALAHEINELKQFYGWDHMHLKCIDAWLHNRPELIADRLRGKIKKYKNEYDHIFVAYADCGASNVSFGLPNRNGINSAFLTMAISAGLTSAITNPLHSEVMQAVLGADVMMGNDPDCRQWISKYRKLSADNATRGRGGRRRRRQATNEQ
jgi:hypothetical protein